MNITKIFLSIAVGITIFIGFVYGIAQAGSQSTPESPAATIRYVDADAPGPTHNGTSWASAFTNLQNALLVAGSGDEIWVAEGVYYPDKGIGQTEDDRTSSFKLKNNVILYGGFDPQSGVDDFSERDWETYISVLSGDIDQNDTVDSNGVVVTTTHISGNNAYHVVRGNGTDEGAVLDGFTITAGRANGGEYSQTIGGGMVNLNDSDPTLRHVTFSGNLAAAGGGGMCNFNQSDPSLMAVVFTGNSASIGNGGGMCNLEISNPTLTEVSFDENSAANNDGGGMYNHNSHPTLMQVSFTDNRAINGGGIYNYQCSPTLTEVTFSNNAADEMGGGMANEDNSNPSLTNVTFSGNTARSSGGMYNYLFSSPTLTNVTFTNNTASSDGGGMYNSSSSPSLSNTILWGNTAGISGNQIYNICSSTVISYTLVQGSGGSGVNWDTSVGNDGGGNLDADPTFVRNPDPGPDGNWDGVDDDYGDLHLRFGSPAIDMGTNSDCPTSDLEGTPRPINAICDMGAYEYQNLAPLGADDSGAGFSTDEDTSFTTDSVLTNDSDPNADVLVLQSIDASSTKGIVADNGDGTFDYDPNGLFEHLAVGQTTTDTFTYTINDGHDGTDTATVMITIEGVNDAPSAEDDSGTGFSTDEDTPFTSANAIANDSDPEGDTLSVQSIDTSGTKGIVANTGDGTFDYDPNGQFEHLAAGETATDSFTYTINDGHGGMDTATVMITITGMDDEALVYLPLVVR
jgi:VCBS repeat-containing protein